MPANTVAFTVTSAEYTDVSGGHVTCAFRLPLISPKNNVIRVHLGGSLPDPDITNFDEFMAPQALADEWQLHFTDLVDSRVYVRAASANAPVRLTVYRK